MRPAACKIASIKVPGPAVRPRGSHTRARSPEPGRGSGRELRVHGGEHSRTARFNAESVGDLAGHLADAVEVLRKRDAENAHVLLLQHVEHCLGAIRRGENQIGMQAQNSLSGGADDRQAFRLRRNKGKRGITGERRESGDLFRR